MLGFSLLNLIELVLEYYEQMWYESMNVENNTKRFEILMRTANISA